MITLPRLPSPYLDLGGLDLPIHNFDRAAIQPRSPDCDSQCPVRHTNFDMPLSHGAAVHVNEADLLD